ncbi:MULTISPECIES: hypothetical protein [unclassified Sphingomonas]|jgi:membrane protein DedA with SNARE-associated domain|uniref:hypothetical protein n=1 Tax=unclassified Sphingomonas TaxID=196159 RepID=UPI0008350463|nr:MULTISPECIES: hypothetical protein [unclassified Sphingomonas]
MAGYIAGRNNTALVLIALEGAAAYQLSALFWYGVGHRLGETRVRSLMARSANLPAHVLTI